jgi:uncharacterized membrane protein
LRTLLALGALPNLHPAVVHFPLALLFAAFGFDVACLLLRRQPWLDRAAAALYLLGALGAGAAFLSGRQAEDGLRQVPPAVQPHIAAHADMAQWTLMTFVAIAVVRAVVGWLELGRRETRRSLVRLLLLTSAATGLGLLVETADRGGALVYRHGVAVAAMLPAEPAKEIEGGTPPRPPASFESRLTRGENGVLLWTPAPEDDEALETILRPAEGTAEWVVTPAPGEANPRGLGLRVSGHALLLLPGEFDDAQVEARLELAEFRGSVGVAHHALGMMKLESFQMDTDGRASLVHLEAGKKQVLDEGPVKVPQGPVALSVSAAGSHLKGMVDGEVVAHGHRGGEAPGGVGLLLDGSGVVRVLEMRVTPLSADH